MQNIKVELGLSFNHHIMINFNCVILSFNKKNRLLTSKHILNLIPTYKEKPSLLVLFNVNNPINSA